MVPSELYHTYCRPGLTRLLKAIRYDQVFHRAQGDLMYYHDEQGKEITVVDFLGGYGTLLFGHNHPVLVDVAVKQFKENLPFSAQGSIRKNAALLGQALNRWMEKTTGASFMTAVCNTGTEAVEAAIKHAELARTRKIDAVLDHLEKHMFLLKSAVRQDQVIIPAEFVEQAAALTGTEWNPDQDSSWDGLIRHCERCLGSDPVFLCLTRSFHGKTSGSLKLTHNETFRKPFERLGIQGLFIDPGDPKSLDRSTQDMTLVYDVPGLGPGNRLVFEKREYVNIAALFIEPMQGEGGIRPISKEFLSHARTCCTDGGFPLVFDEIQCGMGRTGTFLYSEQCGVTADYYLLSKSLGGGLSKLAVLLVQKDMFEEDFDILHTSTFGEDDHSAGVAVAALDLLEKDPLLMENARVRGEQLKNGLNRVKDAWPGVIKEVRGRGLMLGIEFTSQERSGSNFIRSVYLGKGLGTVMAGYFLHEHGIRVAPVLSDNITIRIEPSFYISEGHCEAFIRAVDRLCEILYRQNFYELVKYMVGLEGVGALAPVTDFRREQIIGTMPGDLPQVAFLGHLIDPDHLKLVDGSFRPFSRDQLGRFVELTHEHIPPQVYDQKVVTSITGKQVVVNFIGLHISPAVIERMVLEGKPGLFVNMVHEGLDMAADMGCRVVGFGGYTSIITGNCSTIIREDVAVTSGNSLTVHMGVEALYAAARDKDIDLSGACLAGVGATGNICSTYLAILSETVPKIVMIARKGKGRAPLDAVAVDIFAGAMETIRKARDSGRSFDHLTGVAREICDTRAVKSLLNGATPGGDEGPRLLDALSREMKDRLPVIYSRDMSGLKQANLVIGASNTPTPVIFPEHLNDGPVVINDIAVPADVDPSVEQSKDNVTVVMGGIVKLPRNPDFTITGIPLRPGYAFACMSETILMGLAGIREHFSYGKINRDRVKAMGDIAHAHGFTLGMTKTVRSY